MSRPAVRPIQSPMQSAPGAFSPGIKQLGFEADHFHPIARLKTSGAVPVTYYLPAWYGWGKCNLNAHEAVVYYVLIAGLSALYKCECI